MSKARESFIDEVEDSVEAICERLHQELSLGAEASTETAQRRVLILLDLNGLLGPNDWDTKRDLDLIWRVPKIRCQGFDHTNTLVIDAEERKVKDYRENALVVPEYDEVELRRPVHDRRVLMTLLGYLENTLFPNMQMSTENTIAQILKKNPPRIET
ncbi:hypothetical protein CYMTET_14653 [Cymbomonas tetramitiformis]|uniref:Uncharacterized protein n=1 Tax=Cymbomonas tetramitiformis TaxID=36881 RepID=A0AAE0GFV3_9CHLO|nr:hypothetical protein CYMTET_14653 [Cymbomonas tetramitiformis]